jgi:hypothetical protein
MRGAWWLTCAMCYRPTHIARQTDTSRLRSHLEQEYLRLRLSSRDTLRGGVPDPSPSRSQPTSESEKLCTPPPASAHQSEPHAAPSPRPCTQLARHTCQQSRPAPFYIISQQQHTSAPFYSILQQHTSTLFCGSTHFQTCSSCAWATGTALRRCGESTCRRCSLCVRFSRRLKPAPRHLLRPCDAASLVPRTLSTAASV